MSLNEREFDVKPEFHDSVKVSQIDKIFSQNKNEFVRECKNEFDPSINDFKNNNKRFQQAMENVDIFPKKIAASVKFDNVIFSTYTLDWSWKQLTNGKFLKPISLFSR